MKYNKKTYKLAPGLAGLLAITALFINKNGSYSLNMIILGILLLFTTCMLLVYIIGRKHIKSKWLMPGAFFMFLCLATVFFNNYFKKNNINDNHIMVLLMPIALIGFLYTGFRLQLPKLNGEKEIKNVKRKIILSICVLAVYELAILYGILILHR